MPKTRGFYGNEVGEDGKKDGNFVWIISRKNIPEFGIFSVFFRTSHAY
jgi:hypothetical protein